MSSNKDSHTLTKALSLVVAELYLRLRMRVRSTKAVMKNVLQRGGWISSSSEKQPSIFVTVKEDRRQIYSNQPDSKQRLKDIFLLKTLDLVHPTDLVEWHALYNGFNDPDPLLSWGGV
ncbi:hypothetical protein DINM_000428 [Dirofilaria immitis]|nr:hypothetical protein [Dirofilaria immitis]MCP9257184.1 hypothetical protein [Dirofilaria immitis]